MGAEVEGNTTELLYIGYLIKNIRRVTFRLKGLTAIALIRSIKLPNRQALLAINSSNDFLNFSLLPQLYHMGKMDLKLQFILDLQSHQLRHDKVLLNRSRFLSDSPPTSLTECLLPTFVSLASINIIS